MMSLPTFLLCQLLLLTQSLKFGPRTTSKYQTSLNVRRTSTETGFLSDQFGEKDSLDKRPNYIHRAQVTEDDPKKLLEFVHTVFPDVKRTQAKQWLQYSSLLVNDEPQAKFDLPLRLGDWISVRGGKFRGEQRSGSSGERPRKTYGALPNGLKILYEDEALFVVEKPPGIAVSSSQQVSPSNARRDPKAVSNTTDVLDQAAVRAKQRKDIPIKSNLKSVHSIVSSFLGKRAGSSESKVFVVNRLDDDVSGLVLFAKSAAAKEYLLKNWNSFGVAHYVLCEGLMFPQQGTVKTYIDEGESVVVCSQQKVESSSADTTPDTPSARSNPIRLAVSHYRTIESFSTNPFSVGAPAVVTGARAAAGRHVSLLEVSLETNRRDQMRAQLAFLNHSVCGDYKYGPLSSFDSVTNGVEVGPQSGISIETQTDIDVEREVKDIAARRAFSAASASEIESASESSSSSDFMAVHDPIRRLGVHLSELRISHPLTKDALTLTSACPSAFTDFMRRSSGASSSTSFADNYQTNPAVGSKGKEGVKELKKLADRGEEEGDGDGHVDSLQSGSDKHIAESATSSKVKVFTLTEFLAKSGGSGASADSGSDASQGKGKGRRRTSKDNDFEARAKSISRPPRRK